jgi:hypothetical protein
MAGHNSRHGKRGVTQTQNTLLANNTKRSPICERQTLKNVFHPNPKTVFFRPAHIHGVVDFLVHLNRPKFPEIVFVLQES